MAVRPYQPSDFAGVCRVYLDAKRSELQFEAGPFDFVPLERDDALLAAFNESDVIVYDGDGVSGFAASSGGQLRALFVHGEARGRGVGQALLDAVIRRAQGEVGLHVACSNAGAIRFYEKNGFSRAGESVRRYGGADVVYARMVRPPTLR